MYQWIIILQRMVKKQKVDYKVIIYSKFLIRIIKFIVIINSIWLQFRRFGFNYY